MPAAAQRPLSGNVDLVDRCGDLPVVTVSRIQYLAGFRAETQPHRIAGEPAVRQVVLPGSIGIEPGQDLSAEGGQKIGLVPLAIFGTRVGGVQCDPVACEVEALTQHGTHDFVAGSRIKQAGGGCCRQLIGIVDAIPAGELVFGKNLREIEVGEAGVKNRDVILSLVRDVHVVEPGFEGLRVVLAEPSARTLEGHP